MSVNFVRVKKKRRSCQLVNNTDLISSSYIRPRAFDGRDLILRFRERDGIIAQSRIRAESSVSRRTNRRLSS